MFFISLKEGSGDETQIRTIFGNLQVSFFAEVVPQGQRQLAAKYTRQGEGPADKGWRIILSTWCRKFVQILTTLFLKWF